MKQNGFASAESAGKKRRTQRQGFLANPFHVIKNLFGYRKVSSRGISKNEVRAKAHAALAAYRQPGPGGLPLALHLSEGLGAARFALAIRVAHPSL